MILSVVMIVKDEEKNIERTLSALKPLKDEIETEIIIVDTGSKDKTVDIARKFTEKIYYHEWSGNFSQMRNISISYATGKWLLILDADEELVESKTLIEFLKEKNNLKYNSGEINLKNLFSLDDCEKFEICNCVRLFKNDKDFKYTGLIHEQPKYKKPIYKEALGTFNHYGYLYCDEELKQKKLKRNEELLIKALEKNKNDFYMYYQLGKNYLVEHKYEEAIENFKISLEKNNKYGTLENNIYIYESLSKTYLLSDKFKECESICKEYIEKIDNKNIDIYYYLGSSQIQLNKLEESIENYNRYMFLVDNYKVSTQHNSIYSSYSTRAVKHECMNSILINYDLLGNYEKVISMYSDLIDKGIYNNKNIDILIKALCKLDKYNEIEIYYDKMVKTHKDKEDFISVLERMIFNREYKNLQMILKDMPNNYGELNKVRNGEFRNLEKIKKILKEENSSYYGDLIYFATKEKIDLIDLLQDLDIYKIQKYLEFVINKRRDIIFELYEYIVNSEITFDLKKVKIYLSLTKALLYNGGLVELKLEKIFNLYKAYQYIYTKQKYNIKFNDDDILEFSMDRNEKFILELNKVLVLQNTDNIIFIKKLKELLDKYNEFSHIIKILIKKINTQIDEIDEIKILKKQYKDLMLNSINCGKIQEAEELIKEYKVSLGLAEEILNIEAIIDIAKNDLDLASNKIKEAFLLDINNPDNIFNLGYINELKGNKKEANYIFEYIINNFYGEVVLEAKQQIELINTN